MTSTDPTRASSGTASDVSKAFGLLGTGVRSALASLAPKQPKHPAVIGGGVARAAALFADMPRQSSAPADVHHDTSGQRRRDRRLADRKIARAERRQASR